MSRYQEYDDGTRVYPVRGRPPVPPPNYIAAPGEPFKLIPILPECQHRFVGEFKMPCGKIVPIKSCRKGFKVSMVECTNCITSGRQAAQTV